MKFSYSQEVLSRVWRQRNFAYVISGGLLISNMILGGVIYRLDPLTILVPQFNAGDRIPVSRNKLSEVYLQNWGISLLQDLMTVNPASVDLKNQRFLSLSASAFGVLEPQLKKQADKIKKEKISTAFYPKEVAFEEGAVRVTGDFQSYFGRDKKPITASKTYRLSYMRAEHGVLIVTALKEITP